MQRRNLAVWSLLVLCISGCLSPVTTGPEETVSQIESTEVVYFANTKGFLARPVNAPSAPGIVLIHEWWGLNPQMKSTAEKIAAEGFSVLAVDLFHGEIALDANRARQLSSSVDANEGIAHLKAAVAFLKSNEQSPRVGVWGYCFGGGQAMQFTVSDDPPDASVIYYGNVVTDEELLKKTRGPILGIFGELDTSIPVSRVEEFRTALQLADVDANVIVYPAVGHAFANPSNPNFAPGPTADAWEKTVAFLRKSLVP